MTVRSSKIAQVGCDYLAQIGVAAIRGITQQVGSLFRKHLRPQPFPHCYWKFIDCRMAGNQGDACGGFGYPKIKLFYHTLIRNCFHALSDAKWSLACWEHCRFDCVQKSLGERLRHKHSGSRLRAKIAFRMKL